MNKVKKQHYLPQFYLKNFADSEGRICVVDSTLDIPIIRTRVADAAQGRYYYDFAGDEDQTLEKLFGRLESRLGQEFQAILHRAENNLPLDSQCKNAIISFLKLQFLRSDWMREKIPREFVEEYFKPEYIDKADKLLHAYIIHQAMFVEMLNYIDKYEMVIYTIESGPELFTSSFPLFFHHTGDLEEFIKKLVNSNTTHGLSLDSNLFFPLSSKHSVYIFDPSRPLDFEEEHWFSAFLVSGIAWSKPRIYFKESHISLQLYPLLKPLLMSHQSP